MRTTSRLVVVICAAMSLMGILPCEAGAASHHQGGLCGGASAPSHLVQAHVVGRQVRLSTKVIGHFETNTLGEVTGELVVGQGQDNIRVTQWCRLWVGNKSLTKNTAVTHVLGTTTINNQETYVRLDVRDEDGGRVRVRTRLVSHHDSHTLAFDAESESGWTTITGEGWLSTTRLRISSEGTSNGAKG